MSQPARRLRHGALGLLLVLALVSCSDGAAMSPNAVGGATQGSPSVERAQVGFSAPDFTIKSPEGTPITLSAHRGMPVIINFWATWCGPCNQEIPDLVSIQAEYKDRLAIIGVDVQEEKAVVSDYIAAHHINYAIGIDGTGILGSTYNVRNYPRSLFLNREGIITYIAFGALDYGQIKAHVEEVLAR